MKTTVYYEKLSRMSKEAQRLTENCRAHDCPYLKRLGGGYNISNNGYSSYYCAYCDITGHARIKEPENANPDNCTHWKDKVEDKKTALIDQDF